MSNPFPGVNASSGVYTPAVEDLDSFEIACLKSENERLRKELGQWMTGVIILLFVVAGLVTTLYFTVNP